MTPETVHDLMISAMMVTIKICLPLLLASLIVGILISIFQALTQIQENTLTFVPKLLTMFAVLALSINYIAGNLGVFAEDIYSRIVQIN
ncbi:flagellar biosynthetic protein FliQ [Candidatus Paracaedibacter symbiosus]|uniref:flagellar biosynthetic protein FliQ n=1 Tax=Candidatus Paracaedibacter symbiosus TaxID=244582 RepID=UPI000509DB28|nr:flagellar biosynthetic protein FliQ [Candidatus Paracaedibacter symbiosus]